MKMAMKQCASGHVYDDAKNVNCPYCTGSGNIGVTRPLAGVNESPSFPKTSPVAGSDIPKTMPLDNPETNKTVALSVNEKGIDPVYGWLVCVDGEKKGMDFRICNEKSYIGRQKTNDICLDFDNSVSKEVNAIISYDKRNNGFFIQPSESKNNIYINESLLLNPVQLSDYDLIEIGQTKLIFRSLCGDAFKW